MPALEPEPLLTPAEVAAIFRVDSKTVSRWARKGKLTSRRTVGGHRRYLESEVRALLGRSESDPPSVGVNTLWAAVITGPPAVARKKLRAAGITTVVELTEHSAADLAALGIEGDTLAAVRLALARKGLALHGEILGKVALSGT